MSERLLGLDISSRCIGWAVFDGPTLVKAGKYLVAGTSHAERLRGVEDWCLALLKAWAPDQVIYEKPFFGRHRNAFAVLTMYIAVVLVAYYRWRQEDLPVENRVAAAEVKRRTRCPKGTSHDDRKRLMVRRVNRAFGLRLRYKLHDPKKLVSDDDTADAIAVVWAWALAERPDLDFPVPPRGRR